MNCVMKQVKSVALCIALATNAVAEPFDGFEFLFSWAEMKDEATAAALAEIGVTDATARGPAGFAAARKFGIRPYFTFMPVGPHKQVLGEEAQRRHDFVTGADLAGKSIPEAERRRIVEKRRIAAGCRFGGEPDTMPDVCTTDRIACFLSDTNCVMSKAKIDRLLADNPEAGGVALDFIGFTNLRSCECEDCKARFLAYARRENLEPNESSRDRFFRASLVSYINTLADYVRSVRPGMKVTIHLYPVFLPDPIYGKDLRVDTAQETVAWYFQWPDAKIADYTRRIVSGKYQPGSMGVPFVGLNATPGQALASKTPERLDAELRIVLASGARRLGVCNGWEMVKPGYREVFLKYRRD